MSRVLDDVCRALNVDDDRRARETIAVRIIELARRGERDAERLRQRVMREADPKRPAPPDPVLRWRGVK
ncbi:MAG: hypothetical protein IT536_07990 [Hyphomicrobiales bacterium]|nr:hypothetical protein [Hyphomicrobiales bacterium]